MNCASYGGLSIKANEFPAGQDRCLDLRNQFPDYINGGPPYPFGKLSDGIQKPEFTDDKKWWSELMQKVVH